MSEGCTLAEYARHRGVTQQAVSMAIRDGRLHDSIDSSNPKRLRIADIDAADREWDEKSDNTRKPNGAGQFGAQLQENAAREKHFRALLAELDYKKRAGELVPADEARAAVIEKFTAVKTKLLGIPARIKQRLPHIELADVQVIDELVRETLEDLANGDES